MRGIIGERREYPERDVCKLRVTEKRVSFLKSINSIATRADCRAQSRALVQILATEHYGPGKKLNRFGARSTHDLRCARIAVHFAPNQPRKYRAASVKDHRNSEKVSFFGYSWLFFGATRKRIINKARSISRSINRCFSFFFFFYSHFTNCQCEQASIRTEIERPKNSL